MRLSLATAALALSALASTASAQAARDTPVTDSWDELEPRLAGVYVATVRTRTTRGGRNELCARATSLLHGRALPEREVCTALTDVVARASGAELAITGEAVIATERHGRRERILASLPRSACAAECTEPPRDALLAAIRDGELAILWESVPDRDRACRADAECVLLGGGCAPHAVSDARSAPYRALFDAYPGGAAGSSPGGACRPEFSRAACRARRCEPAH
jgi:hypothetical protein